MPFIAGRSTFQRTSGSLGKKPTAPVITASSPGNGTLSITFTPPTFSGGLPITGYQYSVNGGTSWASTDAGTTSPRLISGLTNGTNYTVLLRAVNGLGGGDSSNAYLDTINLTTSPYTNPSAPTLTSSTPGDGSLSIAFTAGDNGGRNITKYQYTTDGTNWYDTNAGTSSPRLISSLTNGTQYNIRLRAVNAATLVSGASNSINNSTTIPYGLPVATTNNGSDATTTPSAPTTNDPTSVESFGTLTTVSYTSGSGTWTNPYPVGAATGTGTMNGSSGTTSFIYGTTSGSYTAEVAATSNSYAGTTWSRGTTYYYKAKITNTSCSATFNSTVNANGNDTTVTFEYGTSSGSYPSSISYGTVTGTSNTSASATKTSLSAGTYYYRVKAVNAAGTTYGLEKSVTISAKSATGAEKSFTPPSVTTLYEIAMVGGGGGGGYGSGGGGGQVKWWGSASITGTVTYTVGAGAGYAEGSGRSNSGGTSQLKINTTEYNAPGGTGGKSGYQNTGTISEDGGASADNSTIYIGGTGYANGQSKNYLRAGGGGAGSASNGGHAVTSTSNNIPTTPMHGGCGGNALGVYSLGFAGGGGRGYGESGWMCESHTATMPGRGGEGLDPDNFAGDPGDYGNDGKVTFKYYGPA